MPFIITVPLDKNGKVSTLPYSDEELTQSMTWLNGLRMHISQRDLVSVWVSLPQPAMADDISTACMWIDGGPRREVKELRQASPGITILLQSDIAALKSHDPKVHKRLAEVLLPMPKPPDVLNWRNWPEFKGVRVALDEFVDYSPDRGAKWLFPSKSDSTQNNAQ